MATGAVIYRFRAELRRHRAATLVLVVLVGTAAGTVTAALAGARRTASSYTRLLDATTTSDVLVNPDDESFPVEEARRLPQVLSSSLVTGTPIFPTRDGEADFSVPFTSGTSDGTFGSETDRPYALEGRMPTGPDEVFVSRGLARRVGLRVGERAPFAHIVSQDEEGEEPEVETLELTVTGVGNTVYETLQPPAQGFDLILVAPAFRSAHPGASTFAGLYVRLRHGDGDAAAFGRAIGRLGAGHTVFAQFQSSTTAKAQQALRPYVGALAAFAGALALTALLVLGQAILRHLASLAGDDDALAAAGMSRRQLMSLAGLRAGAIGAGGAVVALVVAVAASPLMPLGPAHRFEPSSGFSLDGFVVPAAAIAVVALTLLFGLAVGWRGRRRVSEAPRPGRAGRLSALLRPAPATGLRMALDPGRGDRSAPSRTTVAGGALGLAAVSASLVFGASLGHFLSTPRLYGWAWDAQIDIQSADSRQLPFIESASGVSDATPGLNGRLEVEGASVPAIGLGHGAAALHLPVISGRAPGADDEIALGVDTLRRIGRSVGDRVAVGIGGETATMRVVGTVTFPRFAAYPGADKTGLGVGAQLTLEGLARLEPNDVDYDFVLVRLAAGPTGPRLEQALAAAFADLDPDGPHVQAVPQRPDDLTGYDQVDGAPLVLAGLLALLAAAATGHGLVTAIRRRRRELAVLRAVGFTPGDVRAAVRWQSTVVAVVAVVAGLPVGIALGRLSWTALAQRLGTPAGPVVPAAALAVLVAATLLAALAVAEVPARRAARLRPAVLLRAE